MYEGYERDLEKVPKFMRVIALCPYQKFSLVRRTSNIRWIEENPHAVVAWLFLIWIFLNHKDALESIIPRLVKGSIIVFDELNHPKPGETEALMSNWLNNIKLNHFLISLIVHGLFGEISLRL